MVEKEYVMVCPKCKSFDVGQDKSSYIAFSVLPSEYVCYTCGHKAYIFPEVKKGAFKNFEKK